MQILLKRSFVISSLNPDGLERTIIDTKTDEGKSEESSDPPLAGLDNDYLISIIGISLTFIILILTLYLTPHLKKKREIE